MTLTSKPVRTAWFDLEMAVLRLVRRGGQAAAGVWTVAVASAAVFFILSLGNGLHEYLSERLKQVTPALWVEASPQAAGTNDIGRDLATFPAVTAVSKSVETTVLATRSGSSAAAKLVGYDVDALASILPDALQGISGRRPDGPGEAALGIDLARSLGVAAGDTVALTGPAGSAIQVDVVGTLRAGFSGIDATLILASYETAAEIAGTTGRYGYALDVADGVDLEAVRLALQAETGRWVQPWYEGKQALLEAIEVESRVMFWISLAAVVAAALGSAGVAVLRVVERQSESGILLALGASPANLIRTTLAESVAGAGAAAIAGAGLGVLAVTALSLYPVRLPIEFGLDYLPLQPSWPDFLMSAGLTVVAASFASVVPALRAARTDPAVVLRHG